MMPAAAKLYRRFAASTRGVAAIEFAMILPILVVMFLGSIDGGRAIAVYMKVRTATYTLAAITNQYSTIQSADMTNIVGATSLVLSPYSSAPAIVTISQISVTSATKATVSWSYSLNGTALTQGAPFTVPGSFATCNSYPCYLIYAQVSYSYSPLFGYVFPASIGLSDSIYVTPRSSLCVLYPPQSVSTC
jgi:Flp pilus assembly protein TadG